MGRVARWTVLTLVAASLPAVATAALSTGVPRAAAAVAPIGKIVFVSNRGGTTDLWVMNADGSSPVQLTNDATRESGPRWSPDGSKIAFASNASSPNDIWVMNADGSGATNLTGSHPVLGGGPPSNSPSWSADGTQIAYTGPTGTGFGIRVINVDGTN